jgi:thioredoxin reductase
MRRKLPAAEIASARGARAGTSSMIRNFPGFSQGVSGSRLAWEAWQQAWLFGTTYLFMRHVEGLSGEFGRLQLRLSDGSSLTARTVVIATGASYRRLDVPSLEDLRGRGVFYGAGVSEAPAMRGRKLFVVAGGNSAGQAAMHLAKWAAQVTILVRGRGPRTGRSRRAVAGHLPGLHHPARPRPRPRQRPQDVQANMQGRRSRRRLDDRLPDLGGGPISRAAWAHAAVRPGDDS